ncbi:hypothetical protein EPI10_029086 [Gossypium australe]|uniref:Uncharacterized protein n=1 Tax=Gossypium australe TaxID=47621 RepID=A0A5B6V0F3_9ROSI|nr:hypothetical protein EPI10_029086 [Gossypium australe]
MSENLKFLESATVYLISSNLETSTPPYTQPFISLLTSVVLLPLNTAATFLTENDYGQILKKISTALGVTATIHVCRDTDPPSPQRSKTLMKNQLGVGCQDVLTPGVLCRNSKS